MRSPKQSTEPSRRIQQCITDTARSERCHPEPQAKDLAAAFFAAVICLLWEALRTVHRRPVASRQIARRATRRARSFAGAQDDNHSFASDYSRLGADL